MRIFKQVTQFDFLGKRRTAWIVSLVLLVLSIGSLGIRGLSFGIDFTGGTLVELEYAQSADPVTVRSVLRDAGVDNAIVQYFGTSRDILVRLPVGEGKVASEQSSDVEVRTGCGNVQRKCRGI